MGRIIVVGGGAAGMMAAYAASGRGHRVVLLEKNEKLGKKVYITGKGRCNVTNAADLETFFESICTNEKFLYSALYGYDNRALMAFLESEGCPLKVERGDRVFPVSDHASDVIAAFQRALKRNDVQIMLHTKVRELLPKENGPTQTPEPGTEAAKPENTNEKNSTVGGVMLEGGGTLAADAVIVCTGGLSYPSTGSTGDGFLFAEQTGHKVTACRPSLVPLETAEAWCRELMGLSLKNVQLTMVCDGREVYREFGEMLFTHFGVSGPLVLTASCYLGKCMERKGKARDGSKGAVTLTVDLKPALDEEQLDKRLLRDFEENRNRQFKNALGALFPAKLVPVMVRLSGIDPDRRVNEITRQERRQFVTLIKRLPLTVTGTRPFEEAIVTQGGVSVKDIDPSTMGSRNVKGLYFAGEVLDLDAHTGGFNLQIAWSTGHLAGISAAESIQDI